MTRKYLKDAAPILEMSVHELYTGLRSGKYPGFRVGGARGRWIVDIELVKARVDELMLANVREEKEGQSTGIRRVL